MKIAIFSDAFLPQVNGVVTHLLNTIELIGKKHNIALFVPSPSRKMSKKVLQDIKELRMSITLLPSIPLPLYRHLRITAPYYPFLKKKISEFAPDIIHFHTPFTISLNGITLAKNLQIPIVGTFHTYFMDPGYLRIIGLDKIKLSSNAALLRLLWNISNAFYNRADYVICPSNFVKQDLEKNGVKKPITVVSNGVNIKTFKKVERKQTRNYFLYVGRLSREKSLDVLLDAFNLYSKKHKETRLIIVGEGPLKKELEEKVQTYKLENKIKFVGTIRSQKLINIYKEALAFISASKTETQGITFLEAMAAGLPLIGVNAKAVPELITNNGILCKPDNINSLASAMAKLQGDKELVKKFSRNSLKLVKNHSIEKVVKQLEQIYAKLKLAPRGCNGASQS